MDPGREISAGDFDRYTRELIDGASIHEAIATDVFKVDLGRFVASGRIRWSMPNGGFADRGGAWAVVVKDGLVFRVKGVSEVQHAHRVLEQDDWSASHPRRITDAPGTGKRWNEALQTCSSSACQDRRSSNPALRSVGCDRTSDSTQDGWSGGYSRTTLGPSLARKRIAARMMHTAPKVPVCSRNRYRHRFAAEPWSSWTIGAPDGSS